jgi:hypothetical protein
MLPIVTVPHFCSDLALCMPIAVSSTVNSLMHKVIIVQHMAVNDRRVVLQLPISEYELNNT